MKRLRSKQNTQIELTSLLDVIFIVLMIVVCNQQINMTEKTQEARAAVEQAQEMEQSAEDARAEAEAEKALFEEHREMYEEINSQMSIVTVYADYTPSSPSERSLYLIADTQSSKKIQVSAGTEKTAFAQLEEELDAAVKTADDAGKPVIISINTERILYRDESRLSGIVDDLFRRYDNIYLKQSSGKDVYERNKR